MARQYRKKVKIGDKIRLLKDGAYGIARPAGTVFVIESTLSDGLPGSGDWQFPKYVHELQEEGLALVKPNLIFIRTDNEGS